MSDYGCAGSTPVVSTIKKELIIYGSRLFLFAFSRLQNLNREETHDFQKCRKLKPDRSPRPVRFHTLARTCANGMNTAYRQGMTPKPLILPAVIPRLTTSSYFVAKPSKFIAS